MAHWNICTTEIVDSVAHADWMRHRNTVGPTPIIGLAVPIAISVAHPTWCATEPCISVAHAHWCATEILDSMAHLTRCATELGIYVAHHLAMRHRNNPDLK